MAVDTVLLARVAGSLSDEVEEAFDEAEGPLFLRERLARTVYQIA